MVGLLAISAVFAGVELSGGFKGGYDFVFSKNPSAVAIKDGLEGKLTIKASDDNGIWTINVKGLKDGSLDSGNKLEMNASVSIDKLVSFLGGSMGDFTMKLSAGANSNMTALSAFNDVTEDENHKLQNVGVASIELQMAYGDLIKFNVAGDPTFGTAIKIEDKPDKLTDYNGMTFNKVASLVVSASSEPLDGLALSLGYAFNGTQKNSGRYFQNGFNAAADINIAAMCGFDFDLGVSVFDTFAIGVFDRSLSGGIDDSKANDCYNILNANVYGGLDIFSAYVEYRLAIDIPDEGDAVPVNGLKVGVSSDCGVSGLSVSAGIASSDVSKFADTFEISGSASYEFDGTGLKFAVDLNWANGDKAFTLTPTMSISF